MHSLLYTSDVRLAGDEPAIAGQIDRLIANSARRNAEMGLSGVLIHVDGQFIQVLEGRIGVLETVFERICCDFRHANVRLVDLEPVDARLFADWGMACISADGCADLHLRDELAGIRYMVGVNAREAVGQIRSLLENARAADQRQAA